MSDIAMRFNRDMLAMTAPVEPALAAQGVDVSRDMEFIHLVEPDTLRDAYRLQLSGGVPCLVTATKGMTPAALARHDIADRAAEIALAALSVAASCKSQHTLVELGPSGLPFDPSSAASRAEHADQYRRAGGFFEGTGRDFDGYLLGGFTSEEEAQCALCGLCAVTTKPVFVEFVLDEHLHIADTGQEVERALAVAASSGAAVLCVATNASLQDIAALSRRIMPSCRAAQMPFGVELLVGARTGYTPDDMVQAVDVLHRAGVQFLRAGGQATPAYAMTLAVMSSGFDVLS